MPIDLNEVLTIDFETYFDKEYSLRSKELNLSDYVRDERFLAHCASIKQGLAPTEVYWYDDIQRAFDSISWARWHVLAHNTAFDGLILSQHYGIAPPNPTLTPLVLASEWQQPPRYYLDTLSMARALYPGERNDLDALAQRFGLAGKNPNILGKMKGHREIPPEIREEAEIYCRGDTDKCFHIFSRMASVYPDAELRLIDWTIRQFCDPVLRVDVARAEAERAREAAQKEALIAKTGLTEEQLQSAAKLAEQLKALGVEPPMKVSPRTKLPAYAFASTDEEFLELGAHPDNRVRDIVAARLAAKSTIAETRAQRFVDFGDRPMPAGYNYGAAHTLRWGGANKTNLQNLEKEEKDEANNPVPLTGELRKSILAPDGFVLCVADSGQIEARWTAYLAQQLDLLQLFASGGDPYCDLATEIYGEPVTKSDRDRRAVGKAGVLGLGFYMGAKRFQATLALGILGPKMLVEYEFADGVVRTYRRKNRQIVALWRSMDLLLYKMLLKARGMDKTEFSVHKFPGLTVEFDAQTIWLPSGMGFHYPDLRAEWDERRECFTDYSYRAGAEIRRLHSGILTENLIQRLARDTVAEQLLRINQRWRVVLFSHDELVSMAPVHEAEECMKFMLKTMTTPPKWAPGLPLAAEGGYAENYSK